MQAVALYIGQIRRFTRDDWRVYILWVGLMFGLLFSVGGFLALGWWNGVTYPSFVWNIPLGVFIFITAIAIDTIGHRTTYKEALKNGEDLVHHITIFAGITSVVMLCLAYHAPDFLRIPCLVMVVMSIFYSIIDEGLHWHRYLSQKSDPVEMWSHFFIFLGHGIFVVAWWKWFDSGYPGVAETLPYLPL